MLLPCSVLLVVNIGTVMAYNESYSFIEYWGVNEVTLDGKWTNGDEWHDAPVLNVGTNQGKFEFKMFSPDFVVYSMNWLFEFADNTNDSGDRWQLCMDGPDAASATAPTASSYKIEIEGHTTLKVYVGTGSGWTTATTASAVTWSDSLAASSPHDPATHYICEMIIDKIALVGEGGWASSAPAPYGIRVAMYDASNPGQGWVSWPPASSADNPSSWGEIPTYDETMGAYPEVLTIGVMLVLSTAAVVVSLRYFRKPQKL